ncbi:MAG: aldehyde dehydrogenase family protein [Acidobacteria bacterium]|nr:aldehyde dehydrogenase family protein [Acidobacteriota bacterium]
MESPILVAGAWTTTAHALPVRNPYDDSLVGSTFLAGEAEFETAADAAVRTRRAMAALPAYERAEILLRVAGVLGREREAVAATLAAEAGKPIRDALGEVDRAVLTFRVSAEEAQRIGGELMPLDVVSRGRRRLAITRRVPVGPIAGISPFNFPMNLVAHKLAPAIAAGNPIVLKPATRTPLSALALARLLDEAGVPKGALSVMPMAREVGDQLVTDARFALLSFTGSADVGWQMKARAGRKRVVLELGGNAGVIVDRDADLDAAVAKMVAGGFAYAGQSCVSVQRIYVHDAIYDQFASRLVAAVERLSVGPPLDPTSDLSSLIDEREAARVQAWVDDAVAAGARILTGGRRLGRAGFAPTVLSDVPATSKVCAEEAFAPLVGLYRFSAFRSVIEEINRSRYGLQAGVFTNTLQHALLAFDELEVGGVILNDTPSYRMDQMPYGGVKDSGIGREGPRFAIEEMTDLRLLVINQDR